MHLLSRWMLLFAVSVSVVSCSKNSPVSDREEQEQEEIKGPLLSNEILEQEGVRFTLAYQPNTVRLSLKLYEDNKGTLVPSSLSATQENVVYSVATSELKDNTDYIVEAQFSNVTSNGTFSLTVAGFTDINANKNFVIADVPYTVASNGTSRSYLKIHKGIRKLSFYKL